MSNSKKGKYRAELTIVITADSPEKLMKADHHIREMVKEEAELAGYKVRMRTSAVKGLHV